MIELADSGVEKMESRLAHNQEITGSSPVPATSKAEAFKAMDDFVPRVQPAVTAMNAVLDYSKPITVEQFNDYLMGLFSPPPVGKFRKIRVRTPFGIVEFDPKIVINKSPERGPSELAIELAEPEGSETKPEFFRKIMD